MRIVYEDSRDLLWAWCGDAWYKLSPWSLDIELFCVLTSAVL